MSTVHEYTSDSDATLTTLFRIRGSLYGLDASLVQEVVRVGNLTKVHSAPGDVVGVRNLRGKIVTVIDMGIHMGVGAVQRSSENRLILLNHEGDSYGFLVDSVSEAVMVNSNSLLPATGNLSADFVRRLLGLWRYGSEIVSILHNREIFNWQQADASAGAAIALHP
jgi:purine-binding chemotaxis protein CheW